MSASIEGNLDHSYQADHPRSTHWDELPTDGSHAWLGLMLLLLTAIVTIRGLCWVAATVIRLSH